MKNVKLMALVVALVATTSTLHAAGTTAGTTITNTATVNFQVNSISQTAQTGTATFKVDRKVNFTLALADGAFVSVTPGSTAQVLKYTLTNTGNATEDFILTPVNQATSASTAFSGTDSTDTSAGFTARVDANGNSTYQSGTDTAQYVDGLAADTAVTIFVVADFPLSVTNNQVAGINLEAKAALASGSEGSPGAAEAESGSETDSVEDVVLADSTGTGADSARDGKIKALNAYKVVAAEITVTKTSAVITDPSNCTVAGSAASCGVNIAKRIPGAVVEYTITVANASTTAAATAVVLADAIPANTTYVTSSLDVLGAAEDDDATNGGTSTPDTGDYNVTTGSTVTGRLGTIAVSSSAVLKFRVTVN